MGLFSRPENIAPVPETTATTQEELRSAVEKAKLPENVRHIALEEITKLDRTDPSIAEFGVGVTYVEMLLSLPWNISSQDNLELENAVTVLNQEHFGLNGVKQRILEYLASNITCHIKKSTVLVVDDEEISRDNMAYALGKLSCEILVASNGLEAVSILEERNVDCIVTDLKMQKMDGLELLNYVQEEWPDTKLIIVTGYATVDNAIGALKQGALHYLPKPINLEILRNTVQEILEQQKQACSVSGPILCFTGPPGTGKTSIGKSVANALSRKFVRLSLAGMRDEAELRGHRRTYVGAMAGRIISELNKCGVNNPVFMLDEIDKIGQDFRGDPASVLLEILDPEQNRHFLDYYIDTPFDLSRVMFITTANVVENLPAPLRDRMEIIPFSCYTLNEKKQIGLDYLAPRQLRTLGYSQNEISFTPEAMSTLISGYTRDAGLRSVNREIGNVCRKINLQILQQSKQPPISVSSDDIVSLLGYERYTFEAATAQPLIGVTAGLVWSEYGGQLIYIETAKMKGTGQLLMTGSLGDILKESAQTALSFIRSNATQFSIDENMFEQTDIHVHIPAGDISKDGASAGITIAMALLSLLTRRPARRDVALTGEFTLSGRVLPVGGLREKILAAQQAGVRTILLPERNKREVLVMNDEVRNAAELHFISSINEVVDLVLLPSSELQHAQGEG
ncbi:S16 family serine protease [Halodesulfovibrio sp. MK-HDV]|uniref:S16 family serine protease n=1 Tax=Halodesulfovibrio sp. MK-HDV TaxID=2599925 RepID=UPI001369E74A|nr:S16 family serine protease [Halodesulfovibrio sp. MK-HDV]KAF1074698.1 Lon protease [Halodesulfovibrio sp. MK-HDV]